MGKLCIYIYKLYVTMYDDPLSALVILQLIVSMCGGPPCLETQASYVFC